MPLEPVDRGFETRNLRVDHVGFGDAGRDPMRRVGKSGTDGEQLRLDFFENPGQVGVKSRGPGGSQRGVQFVNFAVRINPCVSL